MKVWTVGLPLSASLICTALLGTPAFAQSVDGAQEVDGAPEEGAEIVVTGSRLRTPNDDSVQPINAIGAAELARTGAVTISDAINEQPQFGNAFGGQNQDINSANQGFNIGTELVNLRNLGPQRTLVLVNGRRHVAGDPGTSAVDLNSIPAGTIDRIDIVTGANSAVYGADAVSGVVNIILKRKFVGTEVMLRSGISSEGDGRELSAGVLHGGKIGDRLTYLAAIEYSDREPIFGRDREWVQGDGATNIFGFSIGSAAVEGGPFTTNVGAFVTTPTGVIPWTTTSTGPLYRYQRVFDRNLQIANERVVVSGNLNFEASNTLNLFLESSFARSMSQVDFEPQFFFFRTVNAGQFDAPPIPASNPFLAGFLRSVGATSLIPGTSTTRRFTQYGTRYAKIDRDLYRIATGANGDLGRFNYEVYYQYGRVEAVQEDGPSIDRNRFFAALNNCQVGDGTYGLANVNYAALGCTPLNPFAYNGLSRQFIDYTLIPDVRSKITNEQHVASGFVSGDLFNVFGAPLSAVLGAEYREESTSTDVHPSLRDRSNGIRQISATQGGTNVKEVFGELRLPIFTDKLQLGGSARYSDYSTVGGEFTWGVNANLRPFEFLRFRGSYGVATRAPNVNELFSSVSDVTGTLRDPCANDFNNNRLADPGVVNPARCAAELGAGYVITEDPATGSVLRFRRGGNDALDSESAKTLTVGAVLSFPSVFRFNMSVDYYDIQLTKVIGSLVPSTVVNQCFAGGSRADTFCDLIVRSSTLQLQSVNTQLFNIAEEDVSGLDIQGRIGFPFGAGRLNLFVSYAHLFERSRTDFAGAPTSSFTGRIDAIKDQANATISYDSGPFGVAYTARVLGPAKKGTSTANLADADNRVPTYWYHDLQLSVAAADRIGFDLGVKNLADKKPPIITEFSNSGLVGSGGITAGGIYDVRGRFLYVQARARF